MQQYNEACAPAEDPQARRPVHVFYPRRDRLSTYGGTRMSDSDPLYTVDNEPDTVIAQ